MSQRPTPELLFGITRDDMRELEKLRENMERAYGGPLSTSETVFCLLAFVAQLRKRVAALEERSRSPCACGNALLPGMHGPNVCELGVPGGG